MLTKSRLRILAHQELKSDMYSKSTFIFISWLAICAISFPLAAQEAADYFSQNCSSCHTIGGGRLTGPDLKGVLDRKDRAWLVQFVQNPQAMIDRGDPYALKLLQESRNVIMPTITSMNPARAESLLALIEVESKQEKSKFAGLQISDRPFTSADLEQGRRLFTGAQRLTNSGPPCFSCHTVRDLGGLHGGRLGPDLTRVFERLNGRKNLAAWLAAPATPTMSSVFKRHVLNPEEILPLIAFLENATRTGGEDTSSAQLVFFLISLGSAALALVIIDQIWKKRFRSVRSALLFCNSRRGEE